jgi:signal transduction histidine kinase
MIALRSPRFAEIAVSVPSIAVPDARPSAAAPSAVETRAALAAAVKRAPWRWAAYDLGIWTLVSLVFALQGKTQSPAPFGRIFVTTFASFLPCALFSPVIAFVSLRFRFNEGARWRAPVAHLATLALFLTLGGALMGALEWSLPWAPAGRGIGAAMRHAVVSYLSIDTVIYVAIAAAFLALAYGRESRERAVRAERLKSQLAEAQLHALGAQLQPHFLFNTLHVISALVRHDPRRAEQLIARLSELLRQMLDDGNRAEISLAEELAFLEKYVDIQEARFGPRLLVSFAVEPSVLEARVPRLVLQPLVENAIRHGLANRSEPGRVEIGARREGDELVLEVRDDGVGVPTGGPNRDGVGLSTTRALLVQLYGPAQRLAIGPAPGGGTLCTVRIPHHRSPERAA